MKIGIGFDSQDNGYSSGVEIARQALEKGAISKADLAIAFCCSSVDAEELFEGMKSMLGDEIPILGGSGIGIITNQ